MKTESHQDPQDPRTTRITIEPEGCDECQRRGKCKYRETKTEHKCPMARGKR